MKQNKLYNVIFPIWLLLYYPPVIFATLIGNFFIDSIVLLLCYYGFKIIKKQNPLKKFYKENIFKVWIFGFLADIAGAIILLFTGIFGDDLLKIPYEISSAINFNPFQNGYALAIVLFALLVSGVLIFILNYKITFKKTIQDKALRFKVSLTIAILTLPWTFLLPTEWFYKF